MQSTDRKIVQLLLRAGLGLAIILMFFGTLLNLVQGNSQIVPVKMAAVLGFVGTDDPLAHSYLSLGSRLASLGILVLAFTPAFRVIALILLWAREKDWKFVWVACVVIVTLLISIALGGG